MSNKESNAQHSLEILLSELAGYYELLGLDRLRAEASARADFAEELGGAAGFSQAA